MLIHMVFPEVMTDIGSEHKKTKKTKKNDEERKKRKKEKKKKKEKEKEEKGGTTLRSTNISVFLSVLPLLVRDYIWIKGIYKTILSIHLIYETRKSFLFFQYTCYWHCHFIVIIYKECASKEWDLN